MSEKIYKCQLCGNNYDEDEAEMLSYECCELELVDVEANPKESGDDMI